MAAAVTLGDARAKSKTAIDYHGRTGQLYRCELPILVNGVERGFLDLEIAVADDVSNQEAIERLQAGLKSRWIIA